MSKLFDNLIWVVIAIFIVFLILLGYKATTMFKKEEVKTENTIRPYEDEGEDDLYADEIGDNKNEIDYSDLEEENDDALEAEDNLTDDSRKDEMEKETVVTDEEGKLMEEEAKVENTVEAESRPEPKPEVRTAPVTEYATADYKYLVIAGSFKSKANALSEMKKFERKGFEPELVQFTNSSLQSISMGKFNSMNEAKNLVSKLKAAGIDSYMHTKREK